MSIEYQHRVIDRSRRIRITVSLEGQVIVVVPRWVSAGTVERFVASKRAWIEKHAARARRRVVVRVPRKDIAALKQKTRAFAENRCAHYAQVYGVSYRTISIRAQKSRWGSCSTHGTLSFNYKIAALPPHVADYVIVHEVCHLREMNHSKEFWDLVAQTVPDHKVVRKELRRMHVVVG